MTEKEIFIGVLNGSIPNNSKFELSFDDGYTIRLVVSGDCIKQETYYNGVWDDTKWILLNPSSRIFKKI